MQSSANTIDRTQEGREPQMWGRERGFVCGLLLFDPLRFAKAARLVRSVQILDSAVFRGWTDLGGSSLPEVVRKGRRFRPALPEPIRRASRRGRGGVFDQAVRAGRSNVVVHPTNSVENIPTNCQSSWRKQLRWICNSASLSSSATPSAGVPPIRTGRPFVVGQ